MGPWLIDITDGSDRSTVVSVDRLWLPLSSAVNHEGTSGRDNLSMLVVMRVYEQTPPTPPPDRWSRPYASAEPLEMRSPVHLESTRHPHLTASTGDHFGETRTNHGKEIEAAVSYPLWQDGPPFPDVQLDFSIAGLSLPDGEGALTNVTGGDDFLERLLGTGNLM